MTVATTLLPGATTRPETPGPKGLPLVGVLFEVRRDPLRYFLAAIREYGDVVRLRLGPAQVFLLANPHHIGHVLRVNAKNYRKSDFYEKVRGVFGEGLITSEGALWQRQRRLVQPAFHRKRIEAFADIMAGTVGEMIEGWRAAARSQAPLDISVEMMRVTLKVVVRALFGSDLGDEEARRVAEAQTIALEHTERRIWSLLDPPPVLPTARHRRFRWALAELDRMVDRLIAERRALAERPDDVLTMLIEARDPETGAPLSERQIRDEVLTLLVSGHETTAIALMWVWWLLSLHPAAARAVRDEAIAVLGERRPTVDDLSRLTYTTMVIEEAMRLYPPAWSISRKAIADDEIGGHHVAAGSTVVLCPYVAHRNPTIWENPEGFEPERFSPERPANRAREAYFPFSSGPRMCIGSHFAMMEMKILVAMVARTASLHVVPGYKVEPKTMISLRPKHGLPMTVHFADV